MPPFDVSKNARQVLSRSTKFDQAETRNDVPVMYRSLSKKHMAYKTFREVLIDVGKWQIHTKPQTDYTFFFFFFIARIDKW